MSNEMLYVLPCFIKDQKKIDAERTGQLATPPFVGEVEIDKENWVQTEALKYPRFTKLHRISLMYEGNCVHKCVVDEDIGSEELLLHFWWATATALSPGVIPAGWGIFKWWPTLLNRSIHNDVVIPDWAKPSGTSKYPRLPVYDLTHVYQGGNSNWDLPLPDLGYALDMWLEEKYPTMSETALLSEVNPNDTKIAENLCHLTIGMEKVVKRITRRS
jgi:hypothetical protein